MKHYLICSELSGHRFCSMSVSKKHCSMLCIMLNAADQLCQLNIKCLVGFTNKGPVINYKMGGGVQVNLSLPPPPFLKKGGWAENVLAMLGGRAVMG